MIRFTGIGSAAWLGFAVGVLLPQAAAAYPVGGYLQVPGVQGRAKPAKYKGWITVQAHYFKSRQLSLERTRGGAASRRQFFSGPDAPAKGPDQLFVSLLKHDPATSALMAVCRRSGKLPELNFAESSDATRPMPEVGARPAAIPAMFEYRIKDVEVSCPVLAGAPEQAFIFKFSDIEWLNYKGPAEGLPTVLPAVSLVPLTPSGKTKSFVLSWMGLAPDADKDVCPAMNQKPEEKEYFQYMTPADVREAKAELAKNGGKLEYEFGGVGRRGPKLLDVTHLPGIVPANVFQLPTTSIAYGLDLDGDGGKRASRPEVPLYRSFTSPDGRKGIDNQLYRATACVEGLKGHVGLFDSFTNESMRNGSVTILFVISGIDNERNDDSIDITYLYSKDPMAKTATGKDILSGYTFRSTEDPFWASYTQRMHGRIVNGVIETDPVEAFHLNRGVLAETVQNARLRLEVAQDGSLKGLMGGYLAWRPYMILWCNSLQELLGGFQCPGLYQAFKNAADGLKNSETGEYDGISMAYEIEGRAAWIPPSELARYFAGGTYASK